MPSSICARLDLSDFCHVAEIAPDDFLLLSSNTHDAFSEAFISQALFTAPDAVIVDHSDAFTFIALSGVFREAWARLCAVQMPDEGFIQGLFADVPCKAFINKTEVLLLAPSTYQHHVHNRIAIACHDLDLCVTPTACDVA